MTYNELEKRAFIEYYATRLGAYMAKLAGLPLTPAFKNITRAAATHTPKILPAAETASKAAPTMMKRFSEAAPHINEVAGLGILAAPSAMSLAGNPMSDHASHATELAGLGVLAGPSAYHAFKSFKPSKALATV